MLCTINTDASFHTRFKVGAFAFWAVSNDFRITKAGYLRNLCVNPDEAEMKCIINAVSTVLSSNKNISKLIINTDSLNSKAVFERDFEHIKKYNLSRWKNLRGIFNKTINDKSKRKISIEFRHVKAHTNNTDARSYVNDWCDKNAKIYLWKRINHLKKQGKI
tara:strand:- start:412 stop:897 length:486 start_codon:yes stop_codon:yes gene_type:complete